MNKKLPVTVEHAELRELAKRLMHMHPTDKKIIWLATALQSIGSGTDANTALGVKRGKGHDDEKFEKHMKNQMAIRWIAGRMNPIDGEKPPLKNVAVEEAALHFGLEVDNLKRACPSKAELKALVEFDWDSQRPRNN